MLTRASHAFISEPFFAASRDAGQRATRKETRGRPRETSHWQLYRNALCWFQCFSSLVGAQTRQFSWSFFDLQRVVGGPASLVAPNQARGCNLSFLVFVFCESLARPYLLSMNVAWLSPLCSETQEAWLRRSWDRSLPEMPR